MIYFNELGMLSPLGNSLSETRRRLLERAQSGVELTDVYSSGRSLPLGRVNDGLLLPDSQELPLPDRSRNNRLALTALSQIQAAVKNAVYAAYEQLHPGLTAYCHALDVRPAKRRAFTIGKGQRCEVDHFCPVGIGCSNDRENLWIQRADTTYNGQPMGFHQKDDLEAWGIAQVKAGALTPEEFDRRIWGDWVSYYLEVRPAHSNVSN